MRDWAVGGDYFSKLLLNAIYHNASRFASELLVTKHASSKVALRRRFYERFSELLRETLGEGKVTTTQALLVISGSLSPIGDDRSTIWLYSGMAFRMMFDLGLHTVGVGAFRQTKASEEDKEIQRRLFWSAFCTIVSHYRTSATMFLLTNDQSLTNCKPSCMADHRPCKKQIHSYRWFSQIGLKSLSIGSPQGTPPS